MFYVVGDGRANEHVHLVVTRNLFLQDHNSLYRHMCESLKADFPWWGDERLYRLARKLNIAAFQMVVFEEAFPMVTDRASPAYEDYNFGVDDTVSTT